MNFIMTTDSIIALAGRFGTVRLFYKKINSIDILLE